MWGKNPSLLLVGASAGTVTLEVSIGAIEKTEIRATI